MYDRFVIAKPLTGLGPASAKPKVIGVYGIDSVRAELHGLVSLTRGPVRLLDLPKAGEQLRMIQYLLLSREGRAKPSTELYSAMEELIVILDRYEAGARTEKRREDIGRIAHAYRSDCSAILRRVYHQPYLKNQITDLFYHVEVELQPILRDERRSSDKTHSDMIWQLKKECRHLLYLELMPSKDLTAVVQSFESVIEEIQRYDELVPEQKVTKLQERLSALETDIILEHN